jgi:hypothetical protein
MLKVTKKLLAVFKWRASSSMRILSVTFPESARPNVKFKGGTPLPTPGTGVLPRGGGAGFLAMRALTATLKRHARTPFRSIVAAVFELD